MTGLNPRRKTNDARFPYDAILISNSEIHRKYETFIVENRTYGLEMNLTETKVAVIDQNTEWFGHLNDLKTLNDFVNLTLTTTDA